eukprot:scaffold227668_cov27-Tisochrysis_lutea.AAC.3
MRAPASSSTRAESTSPARAARASGVMPRPSYRSIAPPAPTSSATSSLALPPSPWRAACSAPPPPTPLSRLAAYRNRRAHASACPRKAAFESGLAPSRVVTSTLAFSSSRRANTRTRPVPAATKSAVCPVAGSLSSSLSLSPAATSISARRMAIRSRPCWSASSRGGIPSIEGSCLAPRSSRRSTVALCPFSTATCNAVAPLARSLFRSG